MMQRKFLSRGVFWFGFLFCSIVLLALLLQPLRITAIRLATLGSIVGAWITLLCLIGPRRFLRIVMLTLTTLTLIGLVSPGRSKIDPTTLRQLYIDELSDYDGTRYVYGGRIAAESTARDWSAAV